jgi:hypothetical protein
MFKVGDKVVPHAKTATGYMSLESCNYWRKAKEKNQFFLYIIQIKENPNYENEIVYVLHSLKNGSGGNFYREEDLTPYIIYDNSTTLYEIQMKVGDGIAL